MISCFATKIAIFHHFLNSFLFLQFTHIKSLFLKVFGLFYALFLLAQAGKRLDLVENTNVFYSEENQLNKAFSIS